LKALGVTSAERANLLPSTPTIAEQGYPDFDVSAWMVLMAPKRTPPAIIERLRSVLAACLGRQDVREKLERIGAIPASGSQDAERFLAREADLWARVIKDSAIKIEQ
jgi:tripartite-type tricarboxylate transporter receptor subunit TctC